MLGRETWLVRLLRPLYVRLLLVLGGERGIPWTINEVEYHIDPRCRNRAGAVYEVPVATFLRNRVLPGSLCIDVGANVGVYVLQFAHWSGPEGRVVAFEPGPGARAALERHVRMNRLDDRVTIVSAAVGAEPGEAVLFANGSEGMNRLHAPNPMLAGVVKPLVVPIVTLDDYCAAHGLQPDWLFLDIEGEELGALRGAGRLIRERGAALGIVVELHPTMWSQEDRDGGARHLLKQLGLRVEPLTGQRDPFAAHGLVYLARQ